MNCVLFCECAFIERADNLAQSTVTVVHKHVISPTQHATMSVPSQSNTSQVGTHPGPDRLGVPHTPAPEGTRRGMLCTCQMKWYHNHTVLSKIIILGCQWCI